MQFQQQPVMWEGEWGRYREMKCKLIHPSKRCKRTPQKAIQICILLQIILYLGLTVKLILFFFVFVFSVMRFWLRNKLYVAIITRLMQQIKIELIFFFFQERVEKCDAGYILKCIVVFG